MSLPGLVRGIVAWALLTLAAAPAVAETSSAGTPWSASAVIERRALPDGTRLVIHPDPSAATVAVCAIKDRFRRFPTHPDLGNRLEQRGGLESEEGSTWCVTLPASEARLAVSTAASLWKREWPEADAQKSEGDPDGSYCLFRLQQLVLQGTERPGLARDGARKSKTQPGAIAIAGNVRLDSALALVEQYFEKPLIPGDPGAPPWVPRQTTERLSVLVDATVSPRIHAGWAIPEAGPDAAAALSVALEIWANGSGARLPRALGGLRGISRETHTLAIDLPGGQIIGLWANLSSNSSADRFFRFVDGSLRRLRLSLPSAAELRRAKTRVLLRAAREWEDPGERARRLAEYEFARGDARRFVAEYESVGRVTARAVRDVAAAHLVETRRSIVEAYPRLWPPDDPRLQGYRLYTAETGDTLQSVATRFRASVAALARANDLDATRADRLLSPGQGIWVPGASLVPASH